MPYELLFELDQQARPAAIWLALGGVVMLSAIALRWRRARQGGATAMPSFMIAFGAVAMAMDLIPMWDHQRLMAALRAGEVEIAEGTVLSHSVEQIARYDSQSKRYRRSEWEAFLVGPIAFGFSRDASAVGFTNSAQPRIELRDGQRLRVHYVEDVAGDFSQRRILRLERAIHPLVSQEFRP